MQGVAEATGDKPFDNMMKNISKGTNKQKTADRKEQQKQTQQRARDAFGNMFGGGNPADKLKIREQGVAEGKVKLYTDPNHFGAEIDDTGFDSLGIVDIPANQLVGFEPDAKMNQPKSKANVEKIVAGLKQGAKLPPLLVRKYKNGYQVLDGHHRFWAYKLLGVKSIPSRIIPDEDIEEISKQGVAEMDKSQKSPAGWNLDDYDYSKGKWTRGKIVTAKDAVKDMGNELNRAFNNTDPKDKEPGVTEADYEIHHHDPEGRLKARYHHGSEYTDDVIRKDADYHQKRNPKDTIKVFKDKKPMESQGVEESLRPGEYHVWTVHFEDGTKGRIRVPNDEITDDQIKAHYAKRGKTVVKVDADWAVHSLDEAPVSNFMTAPQQPIDPREQWKRQVRAMAAQYQRNPSMLASLAKEAGPDSVEQVAWEYLQSAAKGIRMPGADTQPAPVNWDDVIRRLPQGLSGQALLNAAEEYLTGTKGMLRSQVRTLLNEPTNQRSLKGAYDRKLQPSESIDELAEAIDSRLYAMKLAGYDIL